MAAALNVLNGAEIDASTFGTGTGGSMGITVIGPTTIDAENSGIFTGISAKSEFANADSGNGGRIDLVGSDLTIRNGGQISTRSKGGGLAGDVIVSMNSINMDGGAMTSSTVGTGNAGILTLTTTGNLNMSQSHLLVSSKYARGGDITVNAAGNIILFQSQISAKADQSDAGEIELARRD